MRFKKLLPNFWPTLFLPLLVACNKQEPAGFPHSLRPGELLPYLKEITWTDPKCIESAVVRENIECMSYLDGYVYHYGHKLPISGLIQYKAEPENYYWSVLWHHEGTLPGETGAYVQCMTLPGAAIAGTYLAENIEEKTICLHPPA